VVTAIVEEDGRIRLPDEVREAAHLEPGREVEVVVYSDGTVGLFPAEADDEVEYSPEFLAGLDDAEREGGSRVYMSTEEFLAALSDESRGR
jgi:AbrB family looped-hinge helix DNA binding protein